MAPSDQEREADGFARFGPFQVRAEPDQVAAFDAALGLSTRPLSVPLIYPIRWLARPELQEAVTNAIGAQPIHVSQSFDYAGAVENGANYLMDVTIKLHEVPSHRLTVHATVHEQNGEPVLTLETVIYSINTISAVAPSNAPQARKGTLPEVTIAPIDATQVKRYADAADDHGRLHCDPDFARSLGLDGPIVHGMMVMGLFERALSVWFPGAQVNRLSAMFVRPVAVDSGLVIAGRMAPAPASAGHDSQIARLFVRTEDDQLACIGEATLNNDPSTRPARA